MTPTLISLPHGYTFKVMKLEDNEVRIEMWADRTGIHADATPYLEYGATLTVKEYVAFLRGLVAALNLPIYLGETPKP